MEILWWQILLLSLYAGYQILDEIQFNTLNQPVFAGLIAGLIMGDLKTGLIIGGSMQLVILGVGTFGGASKIDANSGTELAVAFSVAFHMKTQQALSTLAIPVASLMVWMDVLARMTNTFFAHRIDKHIENMNYRAIERNFLYGAIPWALSRLVPVAIALMFGANVVKPVVHYLNTDLKWLGDGLTTAGAVLPGVGFAILLRYLPLKKHFPYFILGFMITAIFTAIYANMNTIGTAVTGIKKSFAYTESNIPMLAVALIGLALAALDYKRHAEQPAVSVQQQSTQQQHEAEGEIEDDEL